MVWALLLTVGPLQAEDEPTLSKQTYQVLKSTQQWIETGETRRAVNRLKALVKETAGRPYDQAVVLQSLAHARLAGEAYAAAIPDLRRSLELDVLPQAAEQNIRLNLAQLYLATEAFPSAIELATLWLQYAETPRAKVYVLLGSAHYQLKQFKEAISPLRKAIVLSESPKESWYQSLLSAYNEVEDYSNAVSLLHTMLKRFPERSAYWRQLAGIEMLRERYPEALAVMELAYLRGHLETERDLRNLAQLYIHGEAPYQAAQVIEQGISDGLIQADRKHLELAANAWYQAREHQRAIGALERALAADPDPELGLRLAQLYISTQQWANAEQSLRQLIDQKSLPDKRMAKAWLLLGIARYERDSLEEAKNAFLAASQEISIRPEAEQWLAFLEHSH